MSVRTFVIPFYYGSGSDSATLDFVTQVYNEARSIKRGLVAFEHHWWQCCRSFYSTVGSETLGFVTQIYNGARLP